jgi:hypothetical protein
MTPAVFISYARHASAGPAQAHCIEHNELKKTVAKKIAAKRRATKKAAARKLPGQPGRYGVIFPSKPGMWDGWQDDAAQPPEPAAIEAKSLARKIRDYFKGFAE